MVFGGGDVGQILVAALGDEVGLGDDGDPEVFEVGHAVVGHHGCVFDAVLRVGARLAQRRDRHDELGGCHTVHRHGSVGGVAFSHPCGEFFEVEVVVVQDALARCQAVHPLTQLAALRSAGSHPRDRIEHAAVVPDDMVADLVDLGVTVVTQPNFVAERGDQYLTDVPAAEHHELWRVASLLNAGVKVALSTDMPFGEGDPWATMRAAVHRTTAGGAVLGANECVSAREALTMFFGTSGQPTNPRVVGPGQPGDLCVLASPPDEVLKELDAQMVVATVVAGEVVYECG